MNYHRELYVNRHIYERGYEPNFNPEIIGYIGLENLKFAKNVSNRNVRFDLNLQYENAEHKPSDLDPKLTELLQFLLDNEKRLNFPLENDLERAKFFCYRGILTTISCTPYEQKEPWKVVVILSKGSIYLVQRDTQYKIDKRQKETEKDKRMTAWGHKFEHFIVSDSPDSDPTPEMPLIEGIEFSLVLKTRLNQHTIVYGAEMDGIQCDGPMPLPPAEQGPEAVVKYLSTKKFIELKTNRHIEFSKQERNFRFFKTKKWWCQSFLVGIDTILCGFRNDDGIVEKLQIYPLQQLVEESRQFWKPRCLLNFLSSFLTYVKGCLSKEIEMKHGRRALKNLQSLPLITLVLEWEPNMPVQVTDNYDYEADPLLPQTFLDKYGKKGLHG